MIVLDFIYFCRFYTKMQADNASQPADLIVDLPLKNLIFLSFIDSQCSITAQTTQTAIIWCENGNCKLSLQQKRC